MVIKRVIIRNFKCIKELDIVLAPLTIFIGPNGSGKSSILEALALMSQSATKGTNIKDALHGELVEYEDLKSILFRGQKDVELALGIGLDIRAEEVIEGFRKDLSTFTEIAKSTASSATREGALGYTDLLQKLSIDKKRRTECHLCLLFKRLTLSTRVRYRWTSHSFRIRREVREYI
jgi:predicted ATPase